MAMDPETSRSPGFDFPHRTYGRSLMVHADCSHWLRQIPENSIDAVVTDPPYGVREYEAQELAQRQWGKTGRERFLERMEVLIGWGHLLEQIRPYDPKAGKGRAPYELESMLRVHCVQLFYNLSDPATEDMLYEIESVRRFTGISLSKVPDETTILNFRHLLERHGLPQVLFESIKNHLSEEGLILKEGTIVDASIIEAPSSTKEDNFDCL